MKKTILVIVAMLISAAVHAEDMTCQGKLSIVADTGGDNMKIGQCVFMIDQYTGAVITNKYRIGQPCTARAKVKKDTRGLWIKHAYTAVGPINTSAVDDLIDTTRRADDICRGSISESKEHRSLVTDVCNIRADLSEVLLKMGWCYGKQGQIGADMNWHRCVPNSQRGPFSKSDPESD